MTKEPDWFTEFNSKERLQYIFSFFRPNYLDFDTMKPMEIDYSNTRHKDFGIYRPLGKLPSSFRELDVLMNWGTLEWVRSLATDLCFDLELKFPPRLAVTRNTDRDFPLGVCTSRTEEIYDPRQQVANNENKTPVAYDVRSTIDINLGRIKINADEIIGVPYPFETLLRMVIAHEFKHAENVEKNTVTSHEEVYKFGIEYVRAYYASLGEPWSGDYIPRLGNDQFGYY